MPWLATVSAFASPQPTWGSIRPQRSRPFPLINPQSHQEAPLPTSPAFVEAPPSPGEHPSAAFTPVPSDQPQSHQEAPLPTSPAFVEAPPSPGEHPSAAFTPVPSDQPQSHQEAPLPTSPAFVEAPPSPGEHPSAAFTPVPSDQPQSHQEAPVPTSPAFVEAPPSPSKTQPLYRTWSLILGTLAILATVAFSFMVGSRLGWLVSSSPPAQVPVPRASKSDAARPRAKPAAHTRKSTSLSRTARSTSSAQPVPTHSADDLVVYDHGKVIFRAKPSTKKSGASPVVDASKSTRIAPLPGVWLAPDRAERRLRNRIEPQYPAEAMAAHRSGDVVLEVLVAADGSVVSIRPLSGGPLLAAAAAAAVRQWRYEPYRQHHRPSQFQTNVTLKLGGTMV